MTVIRQASPAQVFAFEQIKAAIADFESGDSNLLDAMDRIKDAIVVQEFGCDPRKGAA